MNPQKRTAAARQHWSEGVAHARALQWKPAADAFETATRLVPRESVYWMNLSLALGKLQRADAAANAAQRAFELAPDSATACRMWADCLGQEHRHAEAVQCFERLAPETARDHDFHAAHGNALFLAGRPQDAIEVFFQALACRIDSALVHYRLGLCFKDLVLKEEASECFRTAAALDDGAIRAMALALLVHESAQACRWEHLQDDRVALLDALDRLDPASGHLLSPFSLLAIDSTPAQQLHIGRLRSAALGAQARPFPPRQGERPPGRIRIGYLSADFYNHATVVLMVELLEQRDRERFEVVLYSHSRDDGSALRSRVMRACDRFVDVSRLGHARLAERIRDDAIDILVDLKGHTRDSRYEVMAWRPAPVQAAWLGYPGTSGADFIDYLIGDTVVTPLSAAPGYSEKIAQMPVCYQPNDRQRALPARPTRAACGLPDEGVVLACFNQAYKFTPETVDAWSRILQQRPDALLWLLSWNPQAERNLLAHFAARGVGADRIVFAPKLSLEDHLARVRVADLFLDTWPCNAHTTASEALWAGVPVLTLPGATFASRVAASLAHATGTEALVCDSVDDYVERAVALCADPARLAALREHLESRRFALPLFDSAASARALEALFLRMHDRAQQGLPPEHLPAVA